MSRRILSRIARSLAVLPLGAQTLSRSKSKTFQRRRG